MGFNPIRSVKNFLHELRNAPTSQYLVSCAAESQFPSQHSLDIPEKVHYLETSRTFSADFTHSSSDELATLPARPAKKTGGFLDKVVSAAGSRWALGFILLLLTGWGILGAVYGATDTWQVYLQDVSSLQSYTSATLLMRQQTTNTQNLLTRICNLLSRSQSNERMVRSLTKSQKAQLRHSTARMRTEITDSLKMNEDLFDRISNAVAKAAGSMIALSIYVIAIFTWVFLGIPAGFTDTWQLWVNTGTALEITIITMFLQNIRKQHDLHLQKTIKAIEQVDQEIEMQLRHMTGDMTPNPTISTEPPTLTRWIKAIDIYGFIIGGSIGICISAVVFGIWLALGDDFEFDDNWWLLIGTYTGLIGFIDSFILKNVDHREEMMSQDYFNKLVDQDFKVFNLIGLETPLEHPAPKLSIQKRISAKVGAAVETTIASYMAIGSVGILLIIATGMGWSETGQLLCNTPTMIFEGFLLLTLLEAHNMADDKKRIIYDDILHRRLVLDKHLAAHEDGDTYSVDEKNEVVVRTFVVNGAEVDMEMGRPM